MRSREQNKNSYSLADTASIKAELYYIPISNIVEDVFNKPKRSITCKQGCRVEQLVELFL